MQISFSLRHLVHTIEKTVLWDDPILLGNQDPVLTVPLFNCVINLFIFFYTN